MNIEPRILVVDDERALLKIMFRVISALPAQVDTAIDGKQALERMRTTAYDLVVSDVRMPELDGAELIRRAESEGLKRGAWVFLTGHADYSPEHLVSLGADEVLRKPLGRSCIIAVVERWSEVGRARMGSGSFSLSAPS